MVEILSSVVGLGGTFGSREDLVSDVKLLI